MNIIPNVAILNEGIANGQRYRESFLQSLVTKGNAKPYGVPSRIGHHKQDNDNTLPSTPFGHYKNFRLLNNSGKKSVVADLHIDDTAEKLYMPNSNLSVKEYMLNMSRTNPTIMGNSIMYEADPTSTDDNMVCKDFNFSDIVSKPAGTKSLFLSFQQIKTNKKPKMKDLFNRLLGVVKMLNFTATLADQRTITIITENDAVDANSAVAVGNSVQLSDGSALPAGSYNLADGRTFTIDANSVITNVAEKAPDPTPAPAPSTTQLSKADFDKFANSVVEVIDALGKRIVSTEQKFQVQLNAQNLTPQPGGPPQKTDPNATQDKWELALLETKKKYTQKESK